MKDVIVRVQKIELNNFKNVNSGFIEFKKNVPVKEEQQFRADIIGIYGQNGSGKTAMIDASGFLKSIMEAEALPEDAYNYINLFEKEAKIKCEFLVKHFEEEYDVWYECNLQKNENNRVTISMEKLSYAQIEPQKKSKSTLIEYSVIDHATSLKPKTKFDRILSDEEKLINLKVIQKLSIEKGTSFIFNEEARNIIYSSVEDMNYRNIVEALVDFAKCDFFVIKNEHNGPINMNFFIPLSFRLEQKEIISLGNIGIGLSTQTVISKEEYRIVTDIITQMNVVLKHIVPMLELELYSYGEQHDDKGNIGIRVELVSIKGDSKLPIKYESEGIKKIISIMSVIIAVYNNPRICLVVDELDSGIYEFLLGEILKVIEDGGKGQLIFTSHNLRPLEVLNKDSLYFTTTNPDNRYIKFTNVKSNNNLRAQYIRSINLGGQKEELYQQTNEIEIQRAFRLVGDKNGTN